MIVWISVVKFKMPIKVMFSNIKSLTSTYVGL